MLAIQEADNVVELYSVKLIDDVELSARTGEITLIHESGFDYDGAVYAVVWNERAYIKKVYLEEDGYRLVSLNPKYPDMFVSAEDNLKILGRADGGFVS